MLRFSWGSFFRVVKYVLLTLLVVNVISWIGLWYILENKEDFFDPEQLASDSRVVKGTDDIYAETGIVAIAGREFEIPVAYVDGRFKNGRKEGSVVLEYVLPDFKSKLEFPSREERMEIIRAGNMSGMLLESSADRPPFDKYVDLLRQTKHVLNDEGVFYGLQKYTAPRPEEEFASKPDDTYLEISSSGKVVSFVRCSIKEQVVVHMCVSMFNDKGLRYRIRFPYRELSNWREQQQRAIAFIDQFEINNVRKD